MFALPWLGFLLQLETLVVIASFFYLIPFGEICPLKLSLRGSIDSKITLMAFLKLSDIESLLDFKFISIRKKLKSG